MQIINLTPHTVNICDEAGNIRQSYPSSDTCRVATEFQPAGTAGGVQIVRTTYGETEGLPAPETDKMYIVSMVVAQANPRRGDLLMPNTAPGQAVRDAAGHILGVKTFCVI